MRYPPFRNTSSCELESAHRRTSPFCRATYITTATSVTVTVYNDLFSVNPANAEAAVWINGAWHQSIYPTADGVTVHVVSLPVGDKMVEIVGGSQIINPVPGPPLGTWIQGVEFNASATLAPTDSAGVAVYGDSIVMGGEATPRLQNCWVMRLRQSYTSAIGTEGYGGGSLFLDGFTTTGRETLASKLAAHEPASVWLAIGTNDYGTSVWNATDFGIAYGDLLDRVHAALPAANIYAQSPIVRAVETANALGNTLGDYRSAISTQCASRAWSTYIDGSAILTVSDLTAGGVHPTTAGHGVYATYVESVL